MNARPPLSSPPERAPLDRLGAGAAAPMPGSGTRLTATAQGYAYSAEPGAPMPFRPAWKPAWTARGVRLGHGLVEYAQPTIDGVPLLGDARHGAPELRLDAAAENAEGESWVCVDVTLDAKGAIAAREIVHAGAPRLTERDRGRCALLYLLWRNRRIIFRRQIVHFDLRHLRILPPEGSGGPAKHLFY